jgi:restriction system protein
VARRKNESLLDVLFDLAAMLPWWVGVVLAAVAYFGFHRAAVAPLPAPTPGQVASLLGPTMWRAVAAALQFVIPLALLGGAAASAISRHRRKNLVEQAASSEGASTLSRMTWQEFEVLVGEAFKLQGYAVAETGGGGADGGIDLVLRKGNEKFLVQCKQWRAMKVGVSTVRELYGVMAAEKAAGGFVVTSGSSTADASEFAHGRNVQLLDGAQLVAMFEKVRTSKPAAPVVGAAPNCPRCGESMIKRIAKQGANAGKPFWGCAGFPGCRGTLPI